ncbi:hypothetical protein, partial [Cronobacter sakazakii]|uniref:hypothetical protein n=1 Tax=Cronobacter sakazakii TaxID=28141 RepID=UPI001F3E7950
NRFGNLWSQDRENGMHDKVVGMCAALHPVSPLIEPKCGWSLGWGFVKLKYRAVRNFTQQKTHQP